MTGTILSNAELARERVVLAHVEIETRVAIQARRRAARLHEKQLKRVNLGASRPIADMPAPSR